jgi:hypothetical protein
MGITFLVMAAAVHSLGGGLRLFQAADRPFKLGDVLLESLAGNFLVVDAVPVDPGL